MARKRFMKRGSFRGGFRRASRRTSNSGLSFTNVLLAGAIYGVVRPMAANMLPTMFSFGPVDSDNVILGGAGYYLGKKQGGLLKAVGTIALATEASIVTNKLMTGNGTKTGFPVAAYDSGYSY